jgi:hypothetical protein
MHHVGSLRYEDRTAAIAAAVVARGDAVAPDVGLDALKNRDEVVGLADNSDRESAPDAETVARAAEVDHRSS